MFTNETRRGTIGRLGAGTLLRLRAAGISSIVRVGVTVGIDTRNRSGVEGIGGVGLSSLSSSTSLSSKPLIYTCTCFFRYESSVYFGLGQRSS